MPGIANVQRRRHQHRPCPLIPCSSSAWPLAHALPPRLMPRSPSPHPPLIPRPSSAPPPPLIPRPSSAWPLARAQAALGPGALPIREAVVAVPAYFTVAQRKATAEAARLAGIEKVTLLQGARRGRGGGTSVWEGKGAQARGTGAQGRGKRREQANLRMEKVAPVQRVRGSGPRGEGHASSARQGFRA
eukprot:365308-Chlamydomonas_euryale.AAC.10